MTKVQLFAHEIDTHDQAKINALLKGAGADPREMTEEQYLHLQANLQRDLIRDHVAPAVTADTLPVFVAPEFFFKWRDNVPYSRATFFNGMTYFETLSAQFPRVLWVTGTTWWSEPVDATHVRVHNSALIFQGGKLLHSWQKERLSQIDGLNQGPESWDRWDADSARVLDGTQDPFFTAAVPNGGAVQCGIEVCLDHLTLKGPPLNPGVLRQKYLAAHADPATGAGVDLHIMTAAGMPLQAANIVARRGGAYFRCDGGSGAASRSQAMSVDRTGASAPAALRAWAPATTAAAVVYVGTDLANRLAIHAPITLG